MLRAARLGLVTAALATTSTVMATAVPAVAHDELVASTPADKSTVDAPVTEVRLEFSNNVQAEFAQVAVLDSSGAEFQDGDPEVAGRTVRQAVRPLGDGPYDVSYRVVSSDGHPVSGTLTFTVTGTVTGTVAEPTPTATPTATPPATPAATPPQAATPRANPYAVDNEPRQQPAATMTATPAAATQDESSGPPVALLATGALAAVAVVVAIAFAATRGRQRPGPFGPLGLGDDDGGPDSPDSPAPGGPADTGSR